LWKTLKTINFGFIKPDFNVQKMFIIIIIPNLSTIILVVHTVETFSTLSPLLKVVDNCGKLS